MQDPASPRHARQLEARLAAAQMQIARLTENNDRLVETLKEARTQILTLQEEVDRFAPPPSGYGLYLGRRDDGTADVFTGGRELRVAVSPTVEDRSLRLGQRALLNDSLHVVDALESDHTGVVVTVKKLLDGNRALLTSTPTRTGSVGRDRWPAS
jgi:proteasome-associated ATPase